MVMLSPTAQSKPQAGGRLVAADGRQLPLASVHLNVEAGGGIARTVLTQSFENPYDEPLEVRYLLPLPADGAVSGFAFVLGEQRIVGEVTGKQQARERFQRAIASGRTAALLEQDRTSLFSQRVGNIPPRTRVTAEVTVDQPLRWLEEGAWEWRFPTVVAPRYQGVVGRVLDAVKLSVPVREQGTAARATVDLRVEDHLTGQVESPSHSLDVSHAGSDTTVSLAKGAALDRDLVVTWPVGLPDVSASVIAARPATAAHDGDTFALITVAPPTSGGCAIPRDLTVLLDTSGSMSGRPLTQAKRVVEALVRSLGINDRMELIEFSNVPSAWKPEPAVASETNKADALRWLKNLRASGCTEMHTALISAIKPLRSDSQRQVVLITDGCIGFEQEIVSTLLQDLPGQARVHTVGVGSGINRSLTKAAARAGRGTELLMGVDESPAKLVYRLLARTNAPLVTDVRLEGASVIGFAPRGLPDLYAESPALIAIRARSGASEVVLRGQTADGEFVQRLTIPALDRGQGSAGVAALFARETVEDLETALTAGGDRSELNGAIEATAVTFQIASRLTSWIAVSQKQTVDPAGPSRTVDQPHALPHGTSAEGLGLREPSSSSFSRHRVSAFKNTEDTLSAGEAYDLLMDAEEDDADPFPEAGDPFAGGAPDPFMGGAASDPFAAGPGSLGPSDPFADGSSARYSEGSASADAFAEPAPFVVPEDLQRLTGAGAPGSSFGSPIVPRIEDDDEFLVESDSKARVVHPQDAGEDLVTEAYELMEEPKPEQDYRLTRSGASIDPAARREFERAREGKLKKKHASTRRLLLIALVLVVLGVLGIVVLSAMGYWGVGPQ